MSQLLLCIRSHSMGVVIAGQTYRAITIKKSECACTARLIVDVGLTHSHNCTLLCIGCEKEIHGNIWWISLDLFAQSADIEEAQSVNQEVNETA